MSVTLCLADVGREDATLVGGKGANLGELMRIPGVSVPPGFCLTAALFETAVERSPGIREAIARVDAWSPEEPGLDAATAQLRSLIETTNLPTELVATISAGLGATQPPTGWAVRSSAISEDSPTASFAGVHESFLALRDLQTVLDAVRRCWASAFGERAVAYRRQQGLPMRAVRMAVVVQQMAAAEVSGVAFTADPVSGDRRVVAIEACQGTGEALVSGRVVPQRMRLCDGDALEALEGPMNLAQAQQLAAIGRRIEAHFGAPQDIEWCLAAGTFWVVQSRPITTLFPVPARDDESRHVYLSVGHQQMMTDAMRPLGLSVWQMLAARPMHEAGGQLFVDITAQLASAASREALMTMLNRDPLVHSAVQELVSRDYIHVQQDAALAGAPAASGIAAASVGDPDSGLVHQLMAQSECSLHEAKRLVEGKRGEELLEAIAADMSQLKQQLGDPRSRQALMTGIQATWWLHDHLLEWLGDASTVDILSQSVDHNITSLMGLELLDVADAIRPHREAVEFLKRMRPDDVFDGLEHVAGGREALHAIRGYLSKYGMRCAGEIDITRKRWREQPGHLASMIVHHVEGFKHGEAERRFESGLARARDAERGVLDRLRQLPDGVAKAAQAHAAIARMRAFIGYREYPKYAWVSRLDVHRQALLQEARRLVERGVINQPDDIYYFRFDELRSVVSTQSADPVLIAQRRAAFAVHERLVPPRVLTSDGEMLFGTFAHASLDADAIPGLPVSAGIAEGRARVVLDPGAARLANGDILVTTYTDPSWTPLFLGIAGLVTEAGGQMSHGAVVAREYGLPAVVAVRDVTRRIKDGQRIRVDGLRGLITILSPATRDE